MVASGSITFKGLIGAYRRLLLVGGGAIEGDISKRLLLIGFSTFRGLVIRRTKATI